MRSSGRRSLTAHPAQLEYLGHVATVVASGHAPLVGVTGLVVDETKNTFVLETANGAVTVPKAGQRFRIAAAGGVAGPRGPAAGRAEGASGDIEVDGRAIGHRPEDRVKKARTR